MGRSVIEGVPFHIENFDKYLGKPIGESDWMTIDQARVNQFGEATDDRNPLHVDPAWSREHSPFDGTIAHGFLTLSMMSYLSWNGELQPDGVDYGINLGFERVRFLAPVMVDDRIKMRSSLLDCKPRGPGKWWFKSRCSIVTEKTKKAALSAVWLVLFINMAQAGEESRPFG